MQAIDRMCLIKSVNCWIPIQCFPPTFQTGQSIIVRRIIMLIPLLETQIHVRSISMNSAVGTIFGSSTAMGGTDMRPVGSAVGGGWLSGAGYVGGVNPTWLTYGKTSSFTRPGPSDTWVFIDENPRTINDGSMAISAAAAPGKTYLIDKPTGLHGGAGALAFADGHAIVHKWKDPRTYFVEIGTDGNVVQSSSLISPDDSGLLLPGSTDFGHPLIGGFVCLFALPTDMADSVAFTMLSPLNHPSRSDGHRHFDCCSAPVSIASQLPWPFIPTVSSMAGRMAAIIAPTASPILRRFIRAAIPSARR